MQHLRDDDMQLDVRMGHVLMPLDARVYPQRDRVLR
jgi:hypothetical protein